MKRLLLYLFLLVSTPLLTFAQESDQRNVLDLKVESNAFYSSDGEGYSDDMLQDLDLSVPITLSIKGLSPEHRLYYQIKLNENGEAINRGIPFDNEQTVIDLSFCTQDAEECKVVVEGDPSIVLDFLAAVENTPGVKETSGTTHEDGRPHTFLPSLVDDEKELKVAVQQIRKRNEILDAYSNASAKDSKLLLYDVANGICSLSGKSCKKPKASVDDYINVRVVNFNPFKHTIEVNGEGGNRHTELGGDWVERMGITPTATDSTGGLGVTEAQADQGSELEFLKGGARLKDEMESFKESALSQQPFQGEWFKAKLHVIEKKIASYFNIASFTASTVMEKAKAWESAASEKDEAAQYVSAIREGLEIFLELRSVPIVFNAAPISTGNNDELVVTISVKEDDAEVRSLPATFNLHGNIKIDFSSGVIASGLVDHLYETEAVEVAAADDNSEEGGEMEERFRVFQKNRDTYDFGLGIMTHIYWRNAFPINGAISLGAMTNADDPIRYFLGGSLLLGREQRLIVSYGNIFGGVNRLVGNLEEGSLIEEATVPTISEKKSSWFLGVTYNLGI